MQRKPGGYRKPDVAARVLSVISSENHQKWFQQIWMGLTGRKDQGARSAVTGGAQMNGFVTVIRDLLLESGLPESTVFHKKRLELPGYFRPEKRWDLLVVADGQLLAHAIAFVKTR